MKYISLDLKKIGRGVSITMLNLTLKELKSIAKSKYINGCKSMAKNQSINLIITGKLSPTPRPAFKINEYIAKYLKES